jgi:hypothetical protein
LQLFDTNWPSVHDKGAWHEAICYMGLFETIKVLIDDGILDLETVNRLFGYRIRHIVKNELIRKWTIDNPKIKDGWSAFIELARLLGHYK